MYANFGDPRSCYRELRHKKRRKKRQFLGKKIINSLITRLDLTSYAKIWTQHGIYEGFTRIEFGRIRSRKEKFTDRKWAKNWTNLSRLYLN